MTTSTTPQSSSERHQQTNSVTYDQDAARTIRNHLHGVTIGEIQERADHFLSRPIAGQTDDEIRAGFNKIVLPGSNRRMTFTKSSVPISEGASFFRGRWLSDPRMELTTTEDFWEPRPELVKVSGRLNSAGEAILYTSLEDPITVIHECRFKVGDTFAISRFQAKAPFQSTFVGEDPLTPGLTPDEISKLQIIQDFLAKAFSAKVDSSNPDPYRLSRLIALEYFDLPPQLFKGWAFRSVADPGGFGWNVSFRPTIGRGALRYKETHVYQLTGFEPDGRRPLTDLVEVIKPTKGNQLSWQSTTRVAVTKPFWF